MDLFSSAYIFQQAEDLWWGTKHGFLLYTTQIVMRTQQSYGSFIWWSRRCTSSWSSYFITLWKDHRQPRSQFDHLCIHNNVSKAANSLFSRTRSWTDKKTEQGNHIYEVYTLCVSISTRTHTQESYGTCSQLGECQHVHWCSVLILEMSARLSLI